MIYGDEIKIKEYRDYLGLNTYTVKLIDYAAVRQSGNLYGYCLNDPIYFLDESGAIAGVITAIILCGVTVLLASCSDGKKFPTYPGNNPTISPGKGWEWRGRGNIGDGATGAWYNPYTGETLHPDIYHGAPIGPHWDYIDEKGNRYRIYSDGRVEEDK